MDMVLPVSNATTALPSSYYCTGSIDTIRQEVAVVGLRRPCLIEEEPGCAGAVDAHMVEIDKNGIGTPIPVYIGELRALRASLDLRSHLHRGGEMAPERPAHGHSVQIERDGISLAIPIHICKVGAHCAVVRVGRPRFLSEELVAVGAVNEEF